MNSVPALDMKIEKHIIRTEESCLKLFVALRQFLLLLPLYTQSYSIIYYRTSINWQNIAWNKRIFLFLFVFSSPSVFPRLFDTLSSASPSDLGLVGWSSCVWRHCYFCAHRAHQGLPEEERRNFFRDTALAHRKWRLQQYNLSVQFLEASSNSVMLLRC